MGERAQTWCIVSGHYVSLSSHKTHPKSRIQCWGGTGNTSGEMGKYSREEKAGSQGLSHYQKLSQCELNLSPAEGVWEMVKDMCLKAILSKGKVCGFYTPAPIIRVQAVPGSVNVNSLELPACFVLEKQTMVAGEEMQVVAFGGGASEH